MEPNKQYGNLTVIESFLKKEKNGDTRTYCKCQCSCGIVIIRRETSLKTSESKKFNISCGCHKLSPISGNQHVNWKGYKDIPGNYFSRVKRGALKRNLEFSINIKDMWEQWEKQNGKCNLTDLPLSLASHRNYRTNMTASLDRIDSNKGYTKDNIQWLHKEVNHMKNSYTQKRFLEICQMVVTKSNPLPQ